MFNLSHLTGVYSLPKTLMELFSLFLFTVQYHERQVAPLFIMQRFWEPQSLTNCPVRRVGEGCFVLCECVCIINRNSNQRAQQVRVLRLQCCRGLDHLDVSSPHSSLGHSSLISLSLVQIMVLIRHGSQT